MSSEALPQSQTTIITRRYSIAPTQHRTHSFTHRDQTCSKLRTLTRHVARKVSRLLKKKPPFFMDY